MAKTDYFLTGPHMDEKKLFLNAETDDAGQFLNIESHPVVPFNCHLFLRGEPQPDAANSLTKLKFYKRLKTLLR